LDVIKSCENASKNKIKYEFDKRRVGDPECLVANGNKVRNILGWKPEFSSLDQIISSAYYWHSKLT
jgi:UDP-glucose 4-epimerase